MPFRMPSGLAAVAQVPAVADSDVVALEESVHPQTRILAGVQLEGLYDGIESDIVQAEAALWEVAGLYPWPEYPQFLTLDPDGAPIIWVSYLSSPAWWVVIIGLLAGFLLLPVLMMLPIWIIDEIFPGLMDMLLMLLFMVLMLWMMRKMLPSLEPGEEEPGEIEEAK